ncbi:MAG: hypothetical protein ABUT20_39395 [Bacteroidota bacterium]
MNTDKAKEFVKAQQDLTTFKNKEAIEKAELQLKSYQSSIEGIQARLNRLLKNPFEEVTNVQGNFVGMRRVGEEELGKLREKIIDLNEVTKALNLQIRELKGLPLIDNNAPPTPPPEPPKKEVGLNADELKKLDELKNKIRDIDIHIAEARSNILNSQKQQQLNALEERYFKERQATGDNNDQLLKLAQQYEIDRYNITAEYQNKIDIALLKDKYDKERQAALKNLDDIRNDDKLNADQKTQFTAATNRLLLSIDQKYLIERENLFAKFSEDRREHEFQQDSKNLADWHAQQKLIITQTYADGKISKVLYDKEIESLEQKTLEYKLQLARDYGKSVVEIDQMIAEGKIKAYDSDLKAFLDREKEKLELQLKLAYEGSEEQLDIGIKLIEHERDAKLEAYKSDAEMRALIEAAANKDIEELRARHLQGLLESYANIYNQFAGIMSAFAQQDEQKANADLARDRRENEQKKKNLKKQLDEKLISQDQYNSEIEKLDRDLDRKQAKIKKDQWERQHSADIIQSIINTALGISRALPNLALAAIAGVLGAVQTATIAGQEAPEFKFGGRLPIPIGGMVMQGPSHKEGGLKIVNSATGEIIATAEGGELIYSQEDTKRILAGQYVPPKFQDGGLLPSANDYPSVNVTRILENMMIEKFGYVNATGIVPKYSKPTSTSTDSSSGDSTDPRAIIQGLFQINSSLKEMNALLSDPRFRNARLDYYQFKEDLDQIDQARKNAQIG